MRHRRKGALGVLLATVLAAAAVLVGTTAAAADPIVIGWAYDSKGAMSPFDTSALASAQAAPQDGQRARRCTRAARSRSRTCDTQGNKPAVAKACAAKLLGQGADVIFTTCDVELAAPVVQEAINRGILAVAACIGSDQMGPKRFGAKKGRLAFSYGNLAQDEGSAMAEYAWKRGWRDAALATDTVIIYFRNVVQAFEARWKQLGGKIVAKETYQSSPTGNANQASVQNAISRLKDVDADVIVSATAPPWGRNGAAVERAPHARRRHAVHQLLGR